VLSETTVSNLTYISLEPATDPVSVFISKDVKDSAEAIAITIFVTILFKIRPKIKMQTK
jgi:hypothetical protein